MAVENHLKAAYREAHRLAAEKLALLDPEQVCSNTRASFDPDRNVYGIEFFGCLHEADRTTGQVRRPDTEAEVPVPEQALILHHLGHARPGHLTGKAISFKEIPGGGAIYCPSFQQRAINPLVKAFANDHAAFASAAQAFGGARETMGNCSFSLQAFPLVPVTYVVWAGDDEVPASGTILFDASVAEFLPMEDIVLAASLGTYRMVGAARSPKGGHA